MSLVSSSVNFFFFFNDTATTEIYTLSLHDALPIWTDSPGLAFSNSFSCRGERRRLDRKSTRLNSSHGSISYAVFCLKKKKRCVRHGDLRQRNKGITLVYVGAHRI